MIIWDGGSKWVATAQHVHCTHSHIVQDTLRYHLLPSQFIQHTHQPSARLISNSPGYRSRSLVSLSLSRSSLSLFSRELLCVIAPESVSPKVYYVTNSCGRPPISHHRTPIGHRPISKRNAKLTSFHSQVEDSQANKSQSQQ